LKINALHQKLNFFFIFEPRLDFGYASKPGNSDSAACIDFQGTTVKAHNKCLCLHAAVSAAADLF
jgi:hypothetical protein